MTSKKTNGGNPPKKTATPKQQPPKPTADSTAYYKNKSEVLFKKSSDLLGKPYPLQPSSDNVTSRSAKSKVLTDAAIKAQNDALRQSRKGKPGYDNNGFPLKKK